MTKQEAIAAIEKEIAETEASVTRLHEEIAGNRCTALGERQARAAIAYRWHQVEGMRAALAIVKQIAEGAEYAPVIEAVR